MKELNRTRRNAAPKRIKGRLAHPLPKTRVEADALVHWADLHFTLENLPTLSLKVSAEALAEPLDVASRLLQGVVLDYKPERPRPCRIISIPCVDGDVHVLLVEDRQETVLFSCIGLGDLFEAIRTTGLTTA